MQERETKREIMANAKLYLVYLFNLLQNREMYTGLVLLWVRVVMPSVKIYVYIAKMPRLKNASCCKRKIYFHAVQHNKRIVAYFTVAKADRVQTGISGAVLQFPLFYIHARFPLNALTFLHSFCTYVGRKF